MQASAPVYSGADESRAHEEFAAWSRFTAPGDSAEFLGAWLSLLCARVQRARAALLLVGERDDGAFSVAAAWPDPQRDLQYLGPAAQRALTERRGVVARAEGVGQHAADAGAHVGYPVEVAGRLCGAVVVDVVGGTSGDLQWVLRQIHWASAWLVDHFRQRVMLEREAELERLATLNGLMATALQHRGSRPGALAVANDLVPRLRCDRVSVGFEEAGRVRPAVMSHTATFDERSDLVRAMGEAMDEVLDLGVPVTWPPAHDDEVGAISHAEASRTLQAQAMLSVPLVADGHTLGVITLERVAGPPFDPDEQRLARAAGVMLGPVWSSQRLNERGPWRRTRDASRSLLQAAFGPRHPGAKLVAGLAAALVVAASVVDVVHRVSARTVIEGSVQIASVAPFDGYVLESLVRAGDTVARGQPMARLDDRDLRLERARWLAEREQANKRYQVAMASADRGTMGVLAAQASQAQAQMSLAEDKLARATLRAPFDGIVVSGDLSQQVGAPVEQGKLLFEVAPLDTFRVVLQVDDRDIAWVSPGQRGTLVLSSLPHQALPFTVRTVTPVASQHDGRNVLRVEAQLDPGRDVRLRPGMEGIGKIAVGERSALWVWTHAFFDWLRLSFWNWTP